MLKTILISGLIISAVCLFISQTRGRTRSKLLGSYGPAIIVGDRSSSDRPTTESDFKFRIVLSRRRGNGTSTTPIPQSTSDATEYYDVGGDFGVNNTELRTLLEASKNNSGMQPSSTEVIWSSRITSSNAPEGAPINPEQPSTTTNPAEIMESILDVSINISNPTETTIDEIASSVAPEAFSQSDSIKLKAENEVPSGKEYLPPPSISTNLQVPEASNTVINLKKSIPASLNFVKNVKQPSRMYVPPNRR